MKQTSIYKRKNLIFRKKFIQDLTLSCKYLIRDSEFEEANIHNKNLMFFLNLVNDSLSSISMLGNRNLCSSLLGKFDRLFDYYNIQKLTKNDTNDISDQRKNYLRDQIKKNKFINESDLKIYQKFYDEKDYDNAIKNYKLIRQSIVDKEYFKSISDELYTCIFDNKYSQENCDRIYDLTNEYFALLIDYLGISMYEIKRIIKNTYSKLLNTKDENCFGDLFSDFFDSYKNDNDYYLYIKVNRKFDSKLVKVLKKANNDRFKIKSRIKLIEELSKKKFDNNYSYNQLIKKLSECDDNNYYIGATVTAKDEWKAIKIFRDTIVKPFIGSLVYSGMWGAETEKEYIVMYRIDEKNLIYEREFHDDIFKPLSQDIADYRDLYKKYMTNSKNNDINEIIDEAIQLLPAYNNKNNSTLNKFTNTWFSLETLFKANQNISNSLRDYASYLVADKMMAGYLYATSIQISYVYFGDYVETPINIVNSFKDFDNLEFDDCCYLEWKIKKIKNMISNYDKIFDEYLEESKELLADFYFLRCRQFHGSKSSQMEIASGLMYDVVNDSLLFYIDYLDIYRNDVDKKSLFNYIRNIKNIKSSYINDEKIDLYDKLLIIYNSVKKI